MQTMFVSLYQQVLDVFIIDPVIDLLTITPGGYKSQVAQNSQLMRSGAWAETALGGEVIHITLAIKEDRE